ncbi:MAG TPA: GNAT family N-acetyltransferase [Caulobacteraceae bacterium]|nr:GNAT family N-acetyltransferase [Caulobacteraceae bacterium]
MIRPAGLAADRSAILALDTGFETRSVFELRQGARDLALVERPLDAPLRKSFPLDDLDDPERPWTDAWVAEEGGRVAGFVACAFRAWNRRMVIWHLYVDGPFRGRGVGRALVEAVANAARARGALSLWLETSNLNVPGVHAYEAMGFALTGIDARLYQGTPAEGEAALFFERQLS